MSAARRMARRVGVAVAAVALLALLELVLKRAINPYIYDILIRIGITIVLAVSLNLINGFTGQFSLGHAGFMAIGGYASGALTYHLGRAGSQRCRSRSRCRRWCCSCAPCSWVRCWRARPA